MEDLYLKSKDDEIHSLGQIILQIANLNNREKHVIFWATRYKKLAGIETKNSIALTLCLADYNK